MGYVNVVKEVGLVDAVALDIYELNLETTNEPYSLLLTISDQQRIAEIVSTLDIEIRSGLRVACIPIYELEFQLADGSTKKLEYSCGDQQANYIRSDQPALEGNDYIPPVAFNNLMEGHIQSTWAQSINPTQAHGLDKAIKLEVFERVAVDSGDPSITSTKVVSRLKTKDLEVIGNLAATLDMEYEFTPSLRYPATYIVSFSLDGGEKFTLGYYRENDRPTLLKGDGGEWRGRSIETPAEFQRYIESLMTSA